MKAARVKHSNLSTICKFFAFSTACVQWHFVCTLLLRGGRTKVTGTMVLGLLTKEYDASASDRCSSSSVHSFTASSSSLVGTPGATRHSPLLLPLVDSMHRELIVCGSCTQKRVHLSDNISGATGNTSKRSEAKVSFHVSMYFSRVCKFQIAQASSEGFSLKATERKGPRIRFKAKALISMF